MKERDKKMESKLITVGWIAALIMAIWILLGGLMAAVVPDLPLSIGFENYTGQSWSDFASANPKLAELYRILHRGGIGSLGFSIAALVIGVILTGYRKGEKWAWFTLLIAGIFGWGGMLYISIAARNTLVLVLTIIGITLFAITILVPARVILARK